MRFFERCRGGQGDMVLDFQRAGIDAGGLGRR
jgi:hypothetical protein